VWNLRPPPGPPPAAPARPARYFWRIASLG